MELTLTTEGLVSISSYLEEALLILFPRGLVGERGLVGDRGLVGSSPVFSSTGASNETSGFVSGSTSGSTGGSTAGDCNVLALRELHKYL